MECVDATALLDTTSPITSCTSFDLIPPRTPLLSVQVALPTTTSTLPIHLRIPLSPSTTVIDVLNTLRAELGLPTSTSDLVGNRSRGDKSRSRARSNASSISSGSGSNAGRDPSHDIQWKVAFRSSGRSLSLEETVMESLQTEEEGAIVVEMDESWLMEKVKPHQSTSPPTNDSEEEESDTLKASNSAGAIISFPPPADNNTSVPSFHGGTSSSTRLSGLFHGWLDSIQHPVPPPSPQLSVASGHVNVRSSLNGLGLQDALKGEGPPRPLLTTTRHRRPASISGPMASPSIVPTPTLRSDDSTTSTTVEVIDEEEWEGFLVSSHMTSVFRADGQDELNLHGEKRKTMANLSLDRKAYLLAQNRINSISNSPLDSPPTPDPKTPQPATFLSLSAGTSLGLTRLLPQLTGSSTDSTRSPSPAKHGWTKRISIASLGSWAGVTPSTDPDHLSVTREEEDGEITPKAEVISVSGLSDKNYGDVKPMERQYTGGLWGWWTGSSKPEEGSPAHFADGLRES